MPIVFATPVFTPSDPGSSAERPMPMSWTGWDGSRWDLSDVDGPLVLSTGVRGLHMPRFNVYTSSSPLVPGEEVLGYALPSRRVFWPAHFFSHSIAEWHEKYGAFFGSMHPVNPGIWTVGVGDAARTLPLTYDAGAADHAFQNDPFVTGEALIGVELVANRPLWQGKPIVKQFGAADGVDFIPAELAPTFHISAAATFSAAQINNPGDEPAYLVWMIDGPLDPVQVGVGDAVINVPFPVAAGSRLIIDTDPAGQFATLNGVDCTRELGFQMFAPVPAKGETPLTIIAGGSGAVSASLTPLYWKAF